MKTILIIGSRPQLIKAGALLKEWPELVVINTGQHYEEMNDLYEKFGVQYSLDIGSHSHAYMTAKMMEKLEVLLEIENPDLVLVIGDTNSTLAGALTAKKMGVRVAHIEAGCRSYDEIPEEYNRIVADHLSDHLLCSTQHEVDNLAKEGLKGIVIGDLMADIVKGERNPQGYVLTTIHRPYNTDSKERLEWIINELKKYDKVIFPIHPRTKKMIKEFKLNIDGLMVIEPVSVDEMIKLECGADLIITDSGGVQRDAYLLGVPSIILRDKSEWEHLKEPGMLGKDVAKKIRRYCEDKS